LLGELPSGPPESKDLITTRYTFTYTPSHDRILPSPPCLYVKIRNTSAIAYRAAYLHGPYTLYVACYPATFDPNTKHEDSGEHGVPQFEPNLKAGGSWDAQLKVPEKIRETALKANVKRTVHGETPSVTWIIEVSSQVIFSNSATVHFEVLVGRDEKSVELGLAGLTGTTHATPGQLFDHQQGRRSKNGHGAAQPKGVFSKAIKLVVDDTASLWNKPTLPEWDDEGKDRGQKPAEPPDPGQDIMTLKPLQADHSQDGMDESTKAEIAKRRKRRKIHLVVLTHGLHSNLGADMLYLKESIDAAAKQARIDARRRKARHQKDAPLLPTDPEFEELDKSPTITDTVQDKTTSTAPLSGGQEDLSSEDNADSDEEDVIVRGFSGNAIKTEKGIQYLGKRLAKYVLAMTYPDQPYLPAKKSVSKTISRALTGQNPTDVHAGLPSHHNSTIHKEPTNTSHLAYQITSISFIGHSLGGLTQTYAIAYIYKHSPEFFKKIKPINFIGLASPFLGLSNENPIYVKFALDFGLVGRTGQDLGLTWRPPTMVRGGWEAMIGGIGTDGKRAQRQVDPGSKPLLRVLPTGPAHQVLKMFRNRTVYANVVNDGIVPLRTSCLLFLDWRGLGRVEKARRENGLVGTMAGWGWAELTGMNTTARKASQAISHGEASSTDDTSADEDDHEAKKHSGGNVVPQPSDDATRDDDVAELERKSVDQQTITPRSTRFASVDSDAQKSQRSPQQPPSPFAAFFSLLRPSHHKQTNQNHTPKQTKIYKRSQTMAQQDSEDNTGLVSPPRTPEARSNKASDESDSVFTPPKTTVFEAAGDILNPPIPTEEFLMNPKKRQRTIFHDRVYHPEDIPAPPVRRRGSILRSLSSSSDSREDRPTTSDRPNTSGSADQTPSSAVETSGMKVEEKIARAYHKDLSWRKVLVRLEPDAHNNMVVRRMFANAYGWPVIKHLVDTHFADTYSANTADEREPNVERAKPVEEGVGAHGEEVRGQLDGKETPKLKGPGYLEKKDSMTPSEMGEREDGVGEMKSPAESSLNSARGSVSAKAGMGRPSLGRMESAEWDDRFFEGTEDEEDDDDEAGELEWAREQHRLMREPPTEV
jgi:hypothetical protein